MWSSKDSDSLFPRQFLQAGLGVHLRPCLVICALFSFPELLLSWTYRSLQRTAQGNYSAHVCLVDNLACCFALRQLPVLCTGSAILLIWFCKAAYLFLQFTQRNEWFPYLQVWTVFNRSCNFKPFFRLGTPPLQHCSLLPVGARCCVFSKYFRLF